MDFLGYFSDKFSNYLNKLLVLFETIGILDYFFSLIIVA